MMMKELGLPDLDNRLKNEIVSVITEWTDRANVGIQSAIDKKHTLLANIRRKSRMGMKKDQRLPISNKDLKYRTWEIQEERHSNAVVFLMMDRSASMWEDRIYTVKALYFWIVQFLKLKYDRVVIKFIAHDVRAKEMEEKEFFTICDSGGTYVSSAYEMCAEMIRHNYPASSWNIYCFHASDGGTFGDEAQCFKLVNEIMDMGATMFAYAEIWLEEWDNESSLYSGFTQMSAERRGVLVYSIQSLEDVFSAIQHFCKPVLSMTKAESNGK